ncbi:hypothetical protein MYAM1_000686 [Malassezia yamatoensis]|uniref:Dynein heavy chain, cytoplasmic n=1 Tax=Malassezia yamatoensis TaxID=253288 RepID=A0AAJ5YPX9_9BASI|nr:hypothetical protein MYAM1_000686 [Malassezia yamatoensis]
MIDMHPTGDWSAEACRTVAQQLTSSLDLGEHHRDVAIAAVEMHLATYAIAASTDFPTSPQHFLAHLHSFIAVLNARKEASEDQQRFRVVGLDRLAETVSQVEAMQASLALQRSSLTEMNDEANERLQRMVHDQQVAESRRETSVELQASLRLQESAVSEQRESVLRQLAEAEPAVLDAQAAVSNIKKQQLTELRSLNNPPAPVKLTMESVCILLGHDRLDGWKSVQAILRREDFISSVVHLDTQQTMPHTVRDRLVRDYLGREEYKYETINHASKACGPLAKWVMAQLNYAEILERVAPLRNEVSTLEYRAAQTKKDTAIATQAIAELEESITTYKSEYASLISQIQSTKNEMQRIEQRVERSVRLLANLEAERQRWEQGRAEFEEQIRTVIGDALLSAALIAYAGFFEQGVREVLWSKWIDLLGKANIPFRPSLSVSDWLVSADTQASWLSYGLPNDGLAIDNAVIMEYCTRYPLIIDPTGEAIDYVQRRHSAQKIAIASCRDVGCVKILESALRFGTPLLLYDAEHLDPVLLPILKQERRRTGGRVLVRVGKQDVDCAPSFRLYLATRSPNLRLPPHICCRLQVVNFTITRESLQAQASQRILKVVQPDVENQRRQVAAAQGEFQRRLQHIDHALLSVLNKAQGHILESDEIIAELEVLKDEAKDLQTKATQAASLASQVKATIKQYDTLAESASAVYFALQNLSELQNFYEWDLPFFWRLLDRVLQAAASATSFIVPFFKALFQEAYRAAAPSIMQEDHLVLAAILAQISRPEHEELHALLSPMLPDIPWVRRIRLDQKQEPERWHSYAKLSAPEYSPCPLENSQQNENDESESESEMAIINLVRRAIAVRIVRPDYAASAVARALETILQVTLSSLPSLADICIENPAGTPIVLGSMPGHDASHVVTQLARSENRVCEEVALGTPEGFVAADRAVAQAAKLGHWVLIQNAHLDSSWLMNLVPRLAAFQSQKSTRVFVTTELNARLLRGALRGTHVIVHEPPIGIKAALTSCLRVLQTRPEPQGPRERMQIYLLVSYLHSTLVERTRYKPTGWTASYEFHQIDFLAALDVIDTWLGKAAGSKAHLAPEEVPWNTIRTMLQQVVYGAKMDRAMDRAMLDSLIERLFVPTSFDLNFVLAPDSIDPLLLPESTQLDKCLTWVSTLPEPQPIQWLSLAPEAERSTAAARMQAALQRLDSVQHLPTKDRAKHHTRLADWPAAADCAAKYIEQLPQLIHNSSPPDNQLTSFWRREQTLARAALSQVRTQLEELVACVAEDRKKTTETMSLMQCLMSDRTPGPWRRLNQSICTSLEKWMLQFTDRIRQASETPEIVAIHALFNPRAYFTATRQIASKQMQVSLEQIELSLDFSGKRDATGLFPIADLLLDGAISTENGFSLNDGETTRLTKCALRWAPLEEQTAIRFPFYLTKERDELLFRTSLPFSSSSDASLALIRAVALHAV